MSTVHHLICRRCVAAALLAIVLLPPSAMAGEQREGPLPDNFGMMEEWLLRGAAPDSEQVRTLAAMGVATIIDLRYSEQRGYDTLIRQLGMRCVRLPLRPRAVPSEEELQQFLTLLDCAGNRPVYVHCRKGKHRTGLLLALYRVMRQEGAPEEALAEMQKYEFGRGHRRMVEFFKDRTGWPEGEPMAGR